MTTNQQILLDHRPQGAVTADCFRMIETPIGQPESAEILVRNHWLSLDPYMRGRISGEKSYAQGVDPGQLMVGGTVGQVIASASGRFKEGDWVLSASGWQTHALLPEKQALKLDPDGGVPLSAYLGVIGMPGITAWVGLMTICEPKAGETVVVDAASGAVGSVVGQLAKGEGCRVVGIAGGPDKCRYVVDELGFDLCLDHRAADFVEQLDRAVPQGVDCVFENVGGAIFEELLARMNPFGRIALCGMVSEINGSLHTYTRMRSILVNRLKLQGFIVSDHMKLWPEIREQLRTRVASGQIRYRESIVEGLTNAPQALVGLFEGRNFGKQLVKLV
ncbi:NADP-dependent oxidoreductase [Orrella marina]|uniref:NADP-dependent oxidoreductase n=1 Tax=Orrella marina TaxID=2163011 RepID=A0A2R4XNU6_9BURK|nr:NADP-dependent oxidoreductase [Orrella marina]AWB35471.1 NADP-dependent oxidoreductase [Orrella marina]